MKQFKIILGLILLASVTTFAQSPRIKLNQITKDTVKGSVLISSPTDSGMVYSRDFYISYGVDTVLIFNGDTITANGGGGGGISSVLTDNVTILGDGTSGNELKVDTATVISTIQGLVDTLTARGYLTAEVDGSVTNEGSLTVQAGGANDSEIQSNTSGSTNVTIAGGSNVTVTESGNTITIASTASGGGGSIPVDTFVTIAGTETITGAKTFTSDLNIDAKIALNAGDNNIVIGDGAGASLVSGQALGNVLVGTQAGAVIDSGDYNVANGVQALYYNTTGSNNIANGVQALYYNTTGSNNIANGYRALYSNTTGYSNVANGTFALYNDTTGYQNVANGDFALYNNTTGYQNVANGSFALYNNTTGYRNIANGYEALSSNISGNNNIANGYYVLSNLSSGSNNQAYGLNAGRYIDGGSNLTTANGSLFIGSNTRASANGNSNEIVIGTNAIGNGSNSITLGATTNELVVMKGRMELNDGGKSVFIGDDAGRVDDGTDNRNVGIGYLALRSNTTGSNNVANGYWALRFNTTGSNNVANGYLALRSNTTGSYNTANGHNALYNNTSGDYNVANGYAALYSLSSGDDNHAYGLNAGRFIDGDTPLDTANGSLFIGSNTKALANNSTNEIVIGTSAIGNGSNTITIGSSTTQSLHTRNYEFDIDQTVGGATDNYVLTYDSLDGQISLEPISLSGSATLDFGSTSSLNSSDLTITVTGAADGDVVSLGVPNASVNANTNYTAWVSAANTVTVRFNNYSLGAVDPASGTFKVKVFK